MNRHASPRPTAVAPSPVDLADSVGMAYARQVGDGHRRDHGLYLTPSRIARHAAAMVEAVDGPVRILDPAAGAGMLCCAMVEELVGRGVASVEVVAYEIDRTLAVKLIDVLNDLRKWAEVRGATLAYHVRAEDFLLANGHVLDRGAKASAVGAFDVVISNPPYFKLGKSDPRALAAASIVHGQPNIYGLFMAVGAAMLRPGGKLSYIVPRSFASGLYFQALRRRFFGMVRPTGLHVFDSRSEAFGRDEVLQENVILAGRREDGWSGGRIHVGESAGVADLGATGGRSIPMSDVLDVESADMVLRIPSSRGAQEDMARTVNGWTGSLSTYGWRVSTGPVVPFRARELQSQVGGSGYVPLLWMRHVTPMAAAWPVPGRKPEHIREEGANRLLVPNRNYVLMRRFSPKEDQRRIVAAPFVAADFPFASVGFENHLNYVHSLDGMTEDETVGLAAVLNSALLDAWFRSVSGNTQVSATEMRSMPLPPLETIREIGREARGVVDLGRIDEIVSVACLALGSRGPDGREGDGGVEELAGEEGDLVHPKP